MNFFEQELHKIVAPKYPDATYVGRACYVRLDELNRAKIQFVTGIVANQYHALRISILNRNEGQVDVLLLNLSDILGKKQTGNPNVTVKSSGANKTPLSAPSVELHSGVCYSGILHVSGARAGVIFSAHALSCCANSGAVCSTQSK